MNMVTKCGCRWAQSSYDKWAMKLSLAPLLAAALVPLLAVGCAATNENNIVDDEGEYTSASAKLLDFEFDGEVLTADGMDDKAIRDQMLFTIGQLNGRVGVGRLDKLALSNVQSTPQGDLTRVTYHAK